VIRVKKPSGIRELSVKRGSLKPMEYKDVTVDFIRKPINPREFTTKVREVLDRGILKS
jgi:hypothetical protein